MTPPKVTSVARSGARTVLNGQAAPDASVRLASPGGQATTTQADGKGDWSLTPPAAAAPGLFGLSMTTEGRQVQAQGYILVTPKGRGALLRAGSGAVTLDPAGPGRITALDFDAEGGAVVSGAAPAETALTVHADGRQVGEGRSDAAGRFSIAFSQPLVAGRRLVAVSSDDWETSATFDVSPAGPVVGAPYRIGATDDGVRVDWMTPGGGLQSTLIRN